MNLRALFLLALSIAAIACSCGDHINNPGTDVSARDHLAGSWQVTVVQSGESDCPRGGFDFSGDGIADSTFSWSAQMSLSGSTATMVAGQNVGTGPATFSGDHFTMELDFGKRADSAVLRFEGTLTSQDALSGTLVIDVPDDSCRVDFRMTWTRQTATSGTVRGTITYTGNAGVPGTNKQILVAVYPFSNTYMQGPPNGSTIQVQPSSSSPFEYSFTLPTGDYHLIAMFDANGDGSFNSGNTDPYQIFIPNDSLGTGTFGDTAARFAVTSGQGTTANITLTDRYKK
jgi:uncharacterized protein (DUF2141 family)